MIAMIHKFLYALICFAPVFLMQGAAHAQDKEPFCGIEYEVIYKLRDPQIGTYSVWDTFWGDQELQESYSHIVPLANGEVFAVGYRDAEDLKPAQIIFAQIRTNGRVRWHKEHDFAGLGPIIKLEPKGDGYMVVANMMDKKKRESVWFGAISAEGEIVSHSTLGQAGRDIVAHDIIMTPMDATAKDPKPVSGYMMAATVTRHGEGQRGSSVFYTLNDKMKMRSKSALIMGLENSIHDLRGLDDGGYLAAGYSMGTDGRKDGWIVRLDKNGVIKWQRQYPRGAGAQFMAADTLLSDAFVVTGTAAPLIPGGARSGWTMAVSRDNGKILWQRYFSGSLEFYGRDMLVNDEGVISVLLDAEVLVEEGAVEDESDYPLNYEEYVVESDFGVTADDALVTDHVRIVQLNPRGVLIKNEEYFNGEGTDLHGFTLGLNGERILIGSTDMVYTLNDAVQIEPTGVEGTAVLRRGRDAWLSAAVPVDRYDDPCKRKAYRAP
jgi:hypothetical protein